jgi:hypothetical protein
MFLLAAYVIALAGPFVAYVIYFFGLGVFANIEIVSPWIMPIVICINFFAKSFDPVTNLYRCIKNMFFSVSLQRYNKLVIRRQHEIFLPRDLIDKFYIPRSRPEIYSSLLRIIWILAFAMLLILVILTIQYPHYHQTDSSMSFLGVQIIFVLPLLAQFMNSGGLMSPLEKRILRSDIEEYIQQELSKRANNQNNDEGQNGDAKGGGREEGDDPEDIELQSEGDSDLDGQSLDSIGGSISLY